MTFEEYLQNKHSDQYIGIKDNMSDNFNDWLEMDINQVIEYAQNYADLQYLEGKLEGANAIVKIIS